jgi:hypothetical protein
MDLLLQALKLVVVLLAAVTLGNWFLGEVRSARRLRKPWYAPYLSLPGIIVLLAIALPIVLWLRG